MHKNPIKARFIIASPKSSIKPLAGTITSIFCLFFREIQTYNDKCRFFTDINTFWIVQNKKPVIDAMNGINKRRKATSVLTFDLSTLYTKLPHNKLLMVLNSLIDFCFDGGESKYITVNNYGARWVKDIKDNVIRLNKQQIKYAVAYLLFHCHFTVGPKVFCQIIGIPMGSDSAPFSTNSFLYFYENKRMNELKKNNLIKTTKLCNIFRFIDDLNSINYDGEFESSYSNIYPKELQLGKKSTEKYEASFLDLDIKIKDRQFHFGLFDKRDPFPFSIVRIPDKSSNVPSSMVYSATGAESLGIARASNIPESFSTAIKPLIACMSRHGLSIGKINCFIPKYFNKHQVDFNNVCQSKQELLTLVF